MYTVASPGCLFTFHSIISDLETSWNHLIFYNSTIWEKNEELILFYTHFAEK